MAGIERLAGALFAEQRKKVDDPVLKDIFTTFIIDEERHSQCAARLAQHYNVHRYRDYEQNEHLRRFRPYFVATIHHLSAEIANAYITSGELLLDIALLRSLNDYVSDAMSAQAMTLINRDESRHIAVDYHMIEHYCSEAYERELAARPRRTLRERLRAYRAFAGFLYHGGPFFRDVFFKPMDLTDPTGKRMREAFKRIQLVGTKPEVASRPLSRFFFTLQALFFHPVIGKMFGTIILRVAGADPRVMSNLYNHAERQRAQSMSLHEMALEALAVKHAES
jgi:rubrerythrin